MDNLRSVIKNLFCYLSPRMILADEVAYNKITEQTFMMLGSGYITRYSNDELSNMYYYLDNEFKWQTRRLKDYVPYVSSNVTAALNVFDALIAFDDAVLIEENGVPLCKYIQLLRWRDMTTVFEEDLFITSFLAFRDSLSIRERYNFFWRPVIGHNNRALNCLVEKEVAENHFHLKGSAPHFHLSWISIMNQVDKQKFVEGFERYETSRLQKNLSMNVNYQEEKLTVMWRQAALIRLHLFTILKNDLMDWGDIFVRADILLECIDSQKDRERILKLYEKYNITLEQNVRLQAYEKEMDRSIVLSIKRRYADRKVRELLNDSDKLADAVDIIQDNIDKFREPNGNRELDYMICEGYLVRNGKYDTNGPLSGERWFMYQMFLAIFSENSEMEKYFNWFYAYLVIKANIRREFVQANVNVGFDNFSKYQDRKEIFIEENSVYEHAYLRMAVRDTIYNQHIRSLEARITPKETAQENLNAIAKNDTYVTEELDDEEKSDLLSKYFYVCHFVKSSEHINNDSPYLTECRHYEKRISVEKQARALAELRESGADEAARVRGIDACSHEIWCRPEVFAQAFRYLKSHSVSEETLKYSKIKSHSLLATYHVGEDFLDIIDGLRAIDEAIRFLNLRCGDRLGHALALGVDIEEWYESKSNRIMINKIGYMDNLVWLYARLRRYNIAGCDNVKSYIEKKFREYFNEIYENSMIKEEMQEIIHNAKKYFEKNRSPHGYNHDNLSFGINEYYDAWKLRGDNPELYRDGFFKIQGQMLDDWDFYAVNREFPHNYKVRYNPEVAMLYHMYHYNKDVKIVGDQMIEVKVGRDLIEAIAKVRSMMQREICSIGIGIETNPSSNYLIGTFRRYDRHPITSWYNYGLTSNQDALEQCPQLQVSINTDDQGVFATYIENEYAYLALALEKCKNAEGQFIYNRTMILQWLDNVRRMGIDQSFGADSK